MNKTSFGLVAEKLEKIGGLITNNGEATDTESNWRLCGLNYKLLPCPDLLGRGTFREKIFFFQTIITHKLRNKISKNACLFMMMIYRIIS